VLVGSRKRRVVGVGCSKTQQGAEDDAYLWIVTNSYACHVLHCPIARLRIDRVAGQVCRGSTKIKDKENLEV